MAVLMTRDLREKFNEIGIGDYKNVMSTMSEYDCRYGAILCNRKVILRGIAIRFTFDWTRVSWKPQIQTNYTLTFWWIFFVIEIDCLYKSILKEVIEDHLNPDHKPVSAKAWLKAQK